MNNGDIFPTFYTAARIARRLWRWTRLFLAGMTCTVLLSYVVVNLSAGRALERQLALIRERGEPLTLTEVAPPMVPDRENAAPLYAQAFQRLPRLTNSASGAGASAQRRLSQADQQMLTALFADDPQQREGISPADIRQVLAGTDETLSLTRQAAAMPRCRFPVNWEAGAGALLPHLPQLRSLTQLLGAHAILSATDGDSDASLADIEAIIGISHHLGSEPLLISQIIRYACLGTAGNSLRQVLSVARVSEAPARRLEQSLEQIDLQGPYARALLGERAFGVWSFDFVHRDPAQAAQILGGGSEGDAGPVLPTTLAPILRTLGEPLLKMDETFYLQYMTAQYDAAKQGDIATAGPAQSDPVFPWFAVVSRIMTPAIGGVQKKRDQALTRLTLARAALALDRYRLQEGSYPESLARAETLLHETLPEDPLNGRMFTYHREGSGYLLYSFGVDGRDDGGENTEHRVPNVDPITRMPPRPVPLKDDIAWHVGA
jgi:hypothetical protein